MRKPRLLPLRLAMLAVLTGCSGFGFDVNGDDESSLHAARRRWDRERPAAYSYVLERLCFCPQEARGPVRIEVHGESVVSRTYTASGQPVAPQLDSLFGPMESVFDVVAQAIDSEADSLTVRYDSRRGYPVTVIIDYIERAADDELTVKVTEYRTLSP